MRKFLFLLLAAGLLYPVLSFATGVKPPKKFGDIDKHNLELLYCPIDSSAPAYYIFDWGEAYFDFNTGDIMLLYHARIKIVNSKGFSRGNVTLSYAVNDPIKHLKAATYNLVDGKIEVTRVDNSMIFKEKVIEDERKMKISFPDIRDGSIIEYSYLKNAGDVYNLVPWTFQSDIPVTVIHQDTHSGSFSHGSSQRRKERTEISACICDLSVSRPIISNEKIQMTNQVQMVKCSNSRPKKEQNLDFEF
jgi:hypothetical protein